MSVFLTPDLKPFYGGTYFPPDDRYGRPSASNGCCWPSSKPGKRSARRSANQSEQITERLQQDRPGWSRTAASWNHACSKTPRPCTRVFSIRTYGGFGSAPKFPHPMDLRLLLRVWKRFGDEDALAHGPPDARPHGHGRHLRSSRRRLSSLQHRRALAGAALREDALRQCPAGCRLPGSVPGHRRCRSIARSWRKRWTTSCAK